jgi:hypothetical protein
MHDQMKGAVAIVHGVFLARDALAVLAKPEPRSRTALPASYRSDARASVVVFRHGAIHL